MLATRLEKKSEMRLGPLDVLEFLFSSKTFCSFHGRCGGKRGKIVPHIVVHFSLLLRLRDTFVPLFLGGGSLFLAPLRERGGLDMSPDLLSPTPFLLSSGGDLWRDQIWVTAEKRKGRWHHKHAKRKTGLPSNIARIRFFCRHSRVIQKRG